MLILGIVLLIIGAVVAAFIHHTIGIIIAVVGGILVLVALLFLADANTADAAILGFGPHAARLLRWAAAKLDGNRFSDEQVAEMDKRLGELFHVADVPVSQGPTTFDHAWAIYPDGTSEDVSSRNQG
jgi:membrane-bound ClpP family serine protease